MPPGIELLNANDRFHYKQRAKRVERLRTEAYKLAMQNPMTFSKVKVKCTFRAADNRRRDSANFYPSYKSGLDGIVDAGVIKDDNDKYVVSFEMVRGENRTDKKSQLIIEIIEVDE